MKNKIIFRADGNSEIGMGHFIRTLALAQMLKDDFTCFFATKSPSELQIRQIEKVCREIIILPNDDTHFSSFANLLKGDEIIVFDNYYFDTEYQREIKKSGCKLVCIDDIHDYHFVSDVIINHGVGVSEVDYSKEEYTRLYIGPSYSLLRDVFFSYAQQNRLIRKAEHLFICMGASDPQNITGILLNRIDAKKFVSIQVVIGSSNLHYIELENLVKFKRLDNVFLHYNIDEYKLAEIASKCDVAACTPSGISYELSTIGIGLVLCNSATNQEHFYKFFLNNGLAIGTTNQLENYPDTLVSLIYEISDSTYLINEQIKYQKKYFSHSVRERFIDIFNSLL